MDVYKNGEDIKTGDFIFSKFGSGKKILSKFFKRLDTKLKFFIFDLWSSRRFTFRNIKSYDEYLKVYKLRYQVYCEEYNYLDPSHYPDQMEQDKYDIFAQHFVVENGSEDIMGYVRLINNSSEGFPIEHEFKLDRNNIKIDKDKTVEISRLILSPEYRRIRLILVLMRGVYHYVKKNDKNFVYSVMDDRLIKMLKEFGFPFRKIGPYIKFQGVTCPNLLIVSEMEQTLKKKNKLLYSFLQK